MKRDRIVAVGVITAALVLLVVTSAVAESKPVEPGNATVEQFRSFGECGCHSALIEQWAPSMHAQALTDPLYLTKLEEAQEASDGKLGAFCNKCHGPIATMTGEMSKGDLSPVSAEGVTCSFCHQVTGLLDGEPANTSHLVETDGVRRAQLKDPQAPHPAEYSAFHETAEFCGGCHNVNHPVNGMHLEATYTEWAESPYARDGIVCQDCHMSIEPGKIGPSSGQAAAGGPQRDNIYKMTFVGGQVALGPSSVAVARLQSAAEMKVEVPQIVAAGEEAEVTVTITNSGAGHYLPTGLTEIRQMWLEVNAEGPDGEVTKVGERKFGTVLEDSEGNSPAELWDAATIKSDDRIPPKESVTETYAFKMPEGAEHTKLTAALMYKSVTDEFAAKAGVENPTTTMASATQEIFASEEARADAAQLEGGDSFDNWNLAVALAGLAVIVGLLVFFVRRSRKS